MNTIKQLIKKVLPAQLIRILVNQKITTTEQYICPVCKSEVSSYLPLPSYFIEMGTSYGYIYNIDDGETLNYEAYLCPSCNSSDRDRLFALYIDKLFNSHKQEYGFTQKTLIDFAPAASLSSYLKGLPKVTYRSADMYMEEVDDKIDIMDMNIYEDNKFDFFICSHILEHVISPDQALKELYRITKPTGWGILMVPIIMGLEETQEDPSHTSAEDRWKYYGQDDHLRMFARKDFVKRIKDAGFEVEELGIEFFGKKDFVKAGISDSSILYIAHKK